MSKNKAKIKLETVNKGIILEVTGEREDILMKLGMILNSFVVSDLATIPELYALVKSVEEFQESGLAEPQVKKEFNNPSDEEYKKEVEKFRKEAESDAIKRKCLICPEKDTCNKKSIDVECNKY